ncbi:MAG: ABC transporter permease [Firmicutes bacterium]|nr:ABC transporter permease [Bacillota bacterium]MCL5038428.1 ABC transporter permease [Bacillota bacterium]
MKGIIIREIRLFVAAPINLGVTLLTPILYGFLFAASLSNALPVVSYQSTTVSYLQYVAPGLATFALVMFANMSGPAVFQEKASGMLREIASCPITPVEYVLGKLITGSGIAAAQALLIFLVFGAFAQLHPTATMLLKLVVVLVIGALGFISLYNSIWVLVRNPQTASLISSMLTTVLTFTSPVFYTIENMPKLLRPLAQVNPMTYVVGLLRYVTLPANFHPPIMGIIAGLIVLATAVIVNVLSMRRSMANL